MLSNEIIWYKAPVNQNENKMDINVKIKSQYNSNHRLLIISLWAGRSPQSGSSFSALLSRAALD